MRPSRIWLVTCVSALLIFAVPLLVAGAVTGNTPEIRLLKTGENFSALIVTRRERVLIINSDDRGVTRSAVGRFARPWEPDATIVIAPADDDAAIGLWEVLRNPQIEQALVIGVPGSDPIWTRIERECAERGIQLSYLATASRLRLSDALLTAEPDEQSVSVHGSQSTVTLSMGNANTRAPAHVAVVNTLAEPAADADLVVAAQYTGQKINMPLVVLENHRMLRLILDDESIRVHGGIHVLAALESN